MFEGWQCVWCGRVWAALSEVLPGNNEVIKDIIKAVLVGAAIWLLSLIGRWLWRLLKRLWVSLRSNDDYRAKVDRARSTVDPEGAGLWLAIKQEFPPQYHDWMQTGPFVMTVANDKGGVGKTTTTVNLASAFAARLTRPVLVIDLDPQGSGSAQMFAGTRWQPQAGQQSPASLAIDGKLEPAVLIGGASPAKPFTWKDNQGTTRQTPNAVGLAAFYELTDTENRAVTEWQLGDRTRDIRYDLFRLLRDPAVRAHFGAVLIDAPPRFSISSIQALCASTHVLIPSVLDNTSAVAVGYFGRQLRRHEQLWPRLKVVGVLGMMTQDLNHEPGALKTATDALIDNLRGTRTDLAYLEQLRIPLEIPYEMSVPDRSIIGRTGGNGIAYSCLGNNANANAVKEVFDRLAQELERRMR